MTHSGKKNNLSADFIKDSL